MKVKELAYLLQVPDEDKKEFEHIIRELNEQGRIFISGQGKVHTLEHAQVVAGTFCGTDRGFGFVRPDNPEMDDIFIPPSEVNDAMHKDRVLCRITMSQSGMKKSEGTIIRVLKRGIFNIVGTFQLHGRQGFVIPDNKKLNEWILVSKKDANGAVPGHKVIVIIKNKRTSNDEPYKGEVVEILGHSNDPGVDILSVISQYDIPTQYPEAVLQQLDTIPDTVGAEECENRRDFRHMNLITVDGEDTKDVDDAIHLELLDNGNYRLGVYIADVTHYVKEGSPLDQEALRRGTSVYLVDRVIPMLPHKLSNGICSLNEQVDRLALCCIMEIDAKGAIVDHEIVNGVINVKKRTTYTIVNDLLTNEESPYEEEYKEYWDMLQHMATLSNILREKRVQRGAIEFDFPEAKIIVDENCKPLDIQLRERNTATSIIEEFMLATNETIAETYYWMEMPFVYRTHEEPDQEKMERLIAFIKNFGFSLKGNGQHPKNIQSLLSKVESTPEEDIISRIVLRSLKQARYTMKNLGHFGLAAKYYCHFTSPIRRYPDLQIHRIIKENITKGIDEDRKNHYDMILPEVCQQCSRTERVAEEAEREVDNLKKVEFMADKMFEVFAGIVSSVTSWGLYVTLPNTIEGMVHIDSMSDDRYIFEEKHMTLVGQRHQKKYTIGDSVMVQLIRASKAERKIDFILYSPEDTEGQNL